MQAKRLTVTQLWRGQTKMSLFKLINPKISPKSFPADQIAMPKTVQSRLQADEWHRPARSAEMAYNEFSMTSYSTHLTLLERLADRADQAAWREFKDRYGQLIRSVARRQGLQDADCDEVVQEVLTSLSRAMPEFHYNPAKGLFRSYLKTITLRAIFGYYKQTEMALGNDNLLQHSENDDALESMWETEWRQYHLRRAMEVIQREFNETDQAAFDNYAVRGETAESTAQQLNLTIDQVYQAKSRILKRLTSLIHRQVQEEG
jgi:RNA polymerase sigma-70 factor (ECF subfamily)